MRVRMDGFELDLSDMLPAVNMEFSSCHIARIIRTQKIDGLGHFFGLPEAALRDVGDYFFSSGRQDGRFDFAR